MKYKEIIAKSKVELSTELARMRKEMTELSIKLKTAQVKNVRQARGLRKDIARIMLALSTKQD